MNYTIAHIAEIIGAKAFLPQPEQVISQLLTDSRTVIDAEGSLFFALMAQRNGHDFIPAAHENGVRNFVVFDDSFATGYPDSNFLVVNDVLQALQSLAAFNRKQHELKVIGITGSNGKTIVKEWLYQLLASDFNIVRSPKSFNSQIGVPLSIWQINENHELGIFEAGISTREEMVPLANIIAPTIGILTNINEAHAEGFDSKTEKLREKLKLFEGVDQFIYAPEYIADLPFAELPGKNKFSWSLSAPADLHISFIEPIEGRNYIRATYQEREIECLIPFSDQASVENGIICWATLLAMGYSPEEADKRLEKLSPISMRLELINGIENCSVIDDSYSADTSSLAIALDFLNQQNQHPKKTLILSDLFETGKSSAVLYTEIAALLEQKNVNRLIGIGEHISEHEKLFNLETTFFDSTQAFIDALPGIHFANETILVKGARRFGFDRISKLLTQKIHDTVLEINLNALAANLQFYRSKLAPKVKVMAMVKAFSYGSGSFEIANLLQYQKVDYLAVAYADEGIALRKNGISTPIMVMSPEPSAFEAMIKHQLEPEIYSNQILNSFLNFLPAYIKEFPIHLKLDTGMHRLGFEAKDLPTLFHTLKENQQVKVVSVFTHLVASDNALHDEFTATQLSTFEALYQPISQMFDEKPLRHVLNTSGISRWPQAQFDMVRIGIGLYGFDGALTANKGLQTVAVLKTTITQIKNLAPGETVGYNRNGLMPNGGSIATVKIGYADGYSRSFGNGVGQMVINGQLVPTIGSICMDMCMLDVSGLKVNVGDEVIVFDATHTIVTLAEQIGTIPYEILTNISQRVKRVYYYE
ncbi:MAG: bifunctional UDP-N-acetylmuramoyl-tripeptide:D-alanyl-D-alanine ligase/alanine racemase [Pedobacter sp.]|nr:bifunctional UDP-N-acetylmuramoyl-tripeptide:D-alanyl-D-alanine ligase/alanine racemase [Pedobacter sp.]